MLQEAEAIATNSWIYSNSTKRKEFKFLMIFNSVNILKNLQTSTVIGKNL